VLIALMLAATISPVGVEVTTKDGSVRLLHVADADATPTQVCARRVDSDDGAVCAPVTMAGDKLVAALDVDDSVDTRYVVRATKSDMRTNSVGAVAVGFGVAAGATLAGAIVFGSVAAGVAAQSEPVSSAAAVTSLSLLAASGASALAASGLAVMITLDGAAVE